jgi:hypothetical protein
MGILRGGSFLFPPEHVTPEQLFFSVPPSYGQ